MSGELIIKSAPQKLSVKVQTIAALSAIVSAVALPQVFHGLGAVSGLGTLLGEAFLPMHLPIILVGLLAGPYAGAISGIMAPLISFMLSGMPRAAMLPFMMIELCAYGFFAGLFKNVKLPSLAKVVTVQTAGRVVRAAAILLAVYGFGSTAVPVAVIWKSILTGLPGIVLQWCLLPLTVFWVENRSKNEQ